MQSEFFKTKLKATANELHQEKTQLRCYEDILLTGNCYNKTIMKRVVKNNVNFKIPCKMEINEEICKSFGNGRKVMKLWIITLQFQLKKQNKQTNKLIY